MRFMTVPVFILVVMLRDGIHKASGSAPPNAIYSDWIFRIWVCQLGGFRYYLRVTLRQQILQAYYRY